MTQNRFVDLIPKTHREDFLSSLLDAYVDKQGLGGMPKTDLDALVVYLYVKYVLDDTFDSFQVAQALMLKESRAKSLYEIGLIKYGELTEGSAWQEILKLFSRTDFEIESYERGQIRFRFGNPALYKFFQARLRRIERTATYSPSYEIVVISIESFLLLLEHVSDKRKTGFSTTEMDVISPLVGTVIKRISDSLGKTKIKDLKDGKKSTSALAKALNHAATFAKIGTIVKSVFELVV